MKRFELNLRDLGVIPFAGGVVPKGLYLRSLRFPASLWNCKITTIYQNGFLRFQDQIRLRY